jgi:uncharacterized protein DUF4388
MSIQGDIQTFALSAIGRMIHDERKTGILKVRSGESVTRIFFKEGGIIFISGDLAADLSLGALLKADKLVKEEEIQRALGVAEKSSKRLGVVLIEHGAVTQESLVKVLNQQFKEAISKVLTWKEGTFFYDDGLDGYVEDIRLDIDPIRLVAEAERWKEYRILIPNDQVVFQIKNMDLRPNNLSAEGIFDIRLLIDGNRTVDQIIQSTGRTRIAVYRALTSLFVQGIIERKQKPEDQLKKQISGDAIIRFFLILVREIISDLSSEMGIKKAASIVDYSIKSSPHYDVFLREINPADTASTIVQKIRERMSRSARPLKSIDLAAGLKNIIVQVLNEEHRLLGLKAVDNTLRRLVSLVEAMPAEQKLVARSVMPLLNKMVADEKHPVETGDIFARTTSGGLVSDDGNGIVKPNLSTIGGAMIIAFYSRIAQLLITDLETDIGVKAHTIFQKILQNSEYYEKYLCRFQADKNITANVESIRRHISNEGHRLSKMSFIKGFQAVIMELLLEERRLLGDKPTRASVFKIRKYMSDPKQKDLKPLAHYFFATLEVFAPGLT